MNIHELDLRHSIRDTMENVTGTGFGRMAGNRILRYCDRTCLSIPQTGLFLGSGSAGAEMELADKLAMTHDNVHLLDKNYIGDLKARTESSFPNVKFIKDGIFTYLSKPNFIKFDLITLIGLEYVLDSQSISDLVPLLPRVLNPNGIVVQSYSFILSNINCVWLENGFERIPESYRSTAIFSFSGKISP